MSGVVIATNRGSPTIELANGSVIRGIISGRLLNHRIKVMTGDRVQVEMTPYDLTKGRIAVRHTGAASRWQRAHATNKPAPCCLDIVL